MSLTLTRLAARVLNQPLMISAEKLDVIVQVLSTRIGLADADVTMEEFKETDQSNGVSLDAAPSIAVIHVYGSLVHRTGGLMAMSGLRSYEAIREDLNTAMKDDSVSGIIMDFASPGGEVNGVFELAKDIWQAGQEKPIMAYINEYAFSAAYLLAAACPGGVFGPPTAMAGSIGVLAKHVDHSGANEKAGLKPESLFVGARKVDGNPDGPLTKVARESLMANLRRYYTFFVTAVSDYRNIPIEVVKDTEAGVFGMAEAETIGLVNGAASIDIVVEKLLTTGGGMSITALSKQFAALMASADEADAIAALAENGYVLASSVADHTAPADVDNVRSEATEAGRKLGLEEGQKAGISLAQDITGVCAVAGLDATATGAIIGKASSVDDAKTLAVDAAADTDHIINSTVSGDLSSTGESQLVVDAKARAESKGV